MTNVVKIANPKAANATTSLSLAPDFIVSGTASGPDVKNVLPSLVDGSGNAIASKFNEFHPINSRASGEYRWRALFVGVPDGQYTFMADGIDATGKALPGTARQGIPLNVRAKIRPLDDSGLEITSPTNGQDISDELNYFLAYGTMAVDVVSATIDADISGGISAYAISNDDTNFFWYAFFPPLTPSDPETTHTLVVTDANSASVQVGIVY